MNTIKDIVSKTGLSAGAIRFRCRKLKLPMNYETEGFKKIQMRAFTDEEVEMIINYRPGTPGRPWGKER